ncbi:MAG: methyltransferase domain-containing protein [Alphaproteobacteria bacterium]|nr:methyltransferase domain-containing protein [Alphaproteobacteria bacterium]
MAGVSLRDRWRSLRTRLLSDPEFQRRATAFPLTRPLAWLGARRSFDLVAGFVYSQTLHALLALGLLERLQRDPMSLEEIAEAAALEPAAALRLMKAADAVDLTERRDDGRWGLGADGAALAGNPGARAMIRHHHALYRDLADPIALLRGEVKETELGKFWRYAREADGGRLKTEDVEDYSRLMAESQSLVANDILAAYPMERHSRILDVGGGDGTFLSAVAGRYPQADLTLFDLPAVSEVARRRLADRGLADRVSVVGGDFAQDALPAGRDLITLVRILHDHEDDKVLTLLSACREALAEGGALLIAEPMSGTRGGARIADAYFGFYLLAMGTGRARTPQEYAGMLESVGFRIITPLSTRNPLMTRVLVARVRA